MTDQEQKDIFANNLQHYLESRNKKQIDVAAELNVSPATVSDWLTAKKLPRMGKINHLSQWLNVTISDLLESHDAFRQEMYDEDNVLFDYKHLSEESKQTVRNVIKALKAQDDNS